jgi:predicted house-cleaning noncanonical NTP pyrophosphatase (MazG superfamily)
MVRDKVPNIMRAQGANPVSHIADEQEYRES